MHVGRPIQNRYLDTNTWWLTFSAILAIAAVAFHLIALRTGLYATPPHPDLRVDVYTHSVSSLALIASLLNLNLGRQRRYYWTIPIATAIVLGLVWEGVEEVAKAIGFPVYNTFWNAVQDVYVDLLGGIAAAFFADEVIS